MSFGIIELLPLIILLVIVGIVFFIFERHKGDKS